MRKPMMIASLQIQRRGHWAIIIAAAVTLFSVSDRDAAAQRSNCGVVGPAANVVCANPALIRLADETQEAFRELVRAAPRGGRPAIMRDQRDWSFTLGQCLNSGGEDCLRQAYEERISTLAGLLGNQIGGETLSVAAPTAVEQRELPVFDDAGRSNQDDTAAPADEFTSADAQDLSSSGDSLADQTVDNETGDEDLGAERGGGSIRTAARSGATASETSDTSTILTGTVWKAEIASGIRPGTIFVFNTDGGLVTADCVESYRIGTWQISSDGKLVLNEGNSKSQTAEIIGIRDRFVRLKIDTAGADTSSGRTLVLRPAVAPFACRSG